MSIKDNADTEFEELLQHMHLSELNVVDSHIINDLDMSEANPVDDTLNTLGMPWEVSRTVFVCGCSHLWVWSSPSLTTPINYSLIQTNF